VSLKATANHARAWIEGRERQKEAGFIFVSWFASRQLSREEKLDLQSAAAIWVENNSSHFTGSVLAVALRLPTASPREEATLLSRARSWLQAHSDKTSAAEAITALIERPCISSHLRDEAVQLALGLAWRTNPNTVRNALEAARELLPKTSLIREEIDKVLDAGT